MNSECGGGHARSSESRSMWYGAVFWSLFCIAAVALRGVRWDESFEDALIFLRQIPYPLDHPTYIFNRGGFSLQIYAAAALWRLWANPVFFNGLHNVLFIASAVLPAFTLGALLGRRALAGHIAVLLILLQIHISFDSVYPLFVWPGVFSYGQVGTAWALLALCAILSGYTSLAGFMIGFMPCIHLGQLPQLLPLAGLALLLHYRRGNRTACVRMLAWGLAGLALNGGFWLIVRAFAAPLPTEGVYAAGTNTEGLWKIFVYFYDPHRRPPVGPNDGNGHAALIVAMLLSGGAAGLEWRRERRIGPQAGLAVYVFTVAAIVYGVMAVQLALGPNTPFLFTGWIPYRLINHGALILVPFIAAQLYRASDGSGREYAAGKRILALVLLFELGKPIGAAVLPTSLYTRYVGPGDGVFLGLCGCSFAALLFALDSGRARRVYAVVGIAALCALAALHRFGAVCAAAGFCVTWALLVREQSRIGEKPVLAWLARPVFTYGCCALVTLVITVQEFRQRETLPLSAFDRAVTRYLAEKGEDKVAILGGPGDLIFPTRTGHASIGDSDAIKMVYMPSLFAAQLRIYADLYGIRYDAPPATPPRPSWRQVWTARTVSEWETLAHTYQFRYVYAPAELSLSLPRVLAEGGGALYAIPNS